MFEKKFEECLFPSRCGGVVDVATARGGAGGARGVVGDVVVDLRCSWSRVEAVQLDYMRK